MALYHQKLVFSLSLIILFVLAGFSLPAQDKDSERLAKRIEPIAREYFRIEDYNRALEGYLLLDSLIPGNTEYHYRIGICYLNTYMKSKAYPYLEFAYNQPDAPENIFLDLGRAYQYGHEYEKAIIFYESYKKQVKFSPEAEKLTEELKLIDRNIQMCRNGLRLVRSPLINMEVVNLGPEINSEFTDFAPLINQNEDLLIFSSKRQAANKKSDPLTGQFYESVFYSTKSGNSWGNARYIPEPVFHQDIHDAAVGLSPDGNQLFLYRGGDNSLVSRITGDLYQSTLKGGKWSDPVMIPEINSEFWESHASISGDGNTLVFTSDREGGLGGTDIYISRRKLNGQWSTPENIGGYINTPFDEDGPFIHPDGNKLYFSSRGHNSMGGYDIFYSEYLSDKGRWTRPVNMGFPISSADDDIFFVWSADGERAYFSSEREDSHGNTDIYMLTRNNVNVPLTRINGTVIEKFEKVPVKSEIVVRDRLSNNLIGIFDSDETGHFSFELRAGRPYSVTVRSAGYLDSVNQLNLDNESATNEMRQDFEIRKRK